MLPGVPMAPSAPVTGEAPPHGAGRGAAPWLWMAQGSPQLALVDGTCGIYFDENLADGGSSSKSSSVIPGFGVGNSLSSLKSCFMFFLNSFW